MVSEINSDIQKYPDFVFDARNLSVKRGGRRVFADISLSLKNQSLIYLHGANGSGKSTLLRMLGDKLKPVNGGYSLLIENNSVAPNNHIMALDHANGLKNTFTLKEHCIYFIKIISGQTPDLNRVHESLKTLKLDTLIDQPIKYFSSGQRRRAALLRFLLVDRPIWFMDEPTVGVDATNRDTLALMIKTHLAKGGAAMIATHDKIDVDGEIMSLDDYLPNEQIEGYWA
jgi:heme exporter protein A